MILLYNPNVNIIIEIFCAVITLVLLLCNYVSVLPGKGIKNLMNAMLWLNIVYCAVNAAVFAVDGKPQYYIINLLANAVSFI
ncbi:MAG: hypothetical protein ACI4JB_07625, partial [Porcipelethomonas sp.]